MILADTSVIVGLLRDRSGVYARKLVELAGDREIVFPRFSELEVLVGAKSDAEWRQISNFFARFRLLDPAPSTWREAARIYFELRRQGQTIRSLVDCCIAQIAMDESTTLVHNDRDFDAIARIRPLNHVHFG
jgi:predicted nucleic acid-binding protein